MNREYKPAETVVNLKEVIWDLLLQWKAVLIVSLIAMLLVGGLKYAKDMNAYKSAKDAAAAEQSEQISPDQKIAGIMDALPADEQSTVEYLVMQEDWISAQKDYISESILMTTNPASQRTLMLYYYISTSGSPDTNTVGTRSFT